MLTTVQVLSYLMTLPQMNRTSLNHLIPEKKFKWSDANIHRKKWKMWKKFNLDWDFVAPPPNSLANTIHTITKYYEESRGRITLCFYSSWHCIQFLEKLRKCINQLCKFCFHHGNEITIQLDIDICQPPTSSICIYGTTYVTNQLLPPGLWSKNKLLCSSNFTSWMEKLVWTGWDW